MAHGRGLFEEPPCKTSLKGDRENLEDAFSLLSVFSTFLLLALPPCHCSPPGSKLEEPFVQGSLDSDTTPKSVLIHLTPDQCSSIGKVEWGGESLVRSPV